MIQDVFKFSDRWSFHEADESNGVALWSNEFGDILSVNYYPMVPDIGAELDDIGSLRGFYRSVAEANGLAPLEIELENLKGLRAVKTLYKIRMDPTGFAFLGSYTLPFANCSYVIKVQAVESGITGMRECAVLLIEDCKEADEETGKLIGWEADPYDANYKADFMANRADHPKYDEKFPEHPLSRTREYLKEIFDDIEFDNSLKDLPAFEGPKRSKSKPWWKFFGR
ncbi:hypothetical protein ONV78_30770 [Hahella sp. CR1]|uniref:hypothetical protein n=1 Tax=Hahella sp. CR1 TaxID=2992807 RepID=UPI0024413391|nr:hypothetical protein [Hahella sp. CR1]MDG9672155.1 hypothetical protein [Hahella sp. CR1]